MKTALCGLFFTLAVTLCSGEAEDRAPRYLLSNNNSPCVDAITTCTSYGTTACQEPYVQWATVNCAKYCGMCKAATPTPPPTHGTWTHWSTWSHCAATCGTSVQHRTRHCNGGHLRLPCTGASIISRYCHLTSCPTTTTTPAPPKPVDGHWGAWGGYSHCSHTCGTGVMTRHRTCNHPAPSHGGHNCYGSSTQLASCHHRACATTTTTPAPVNGNWGSWSSYSHCSHSCGSGTMTRHRSCNHPAPAHGGHSCHGSSTMTTACHVRACATTTTTPAPVNGNWGAWGSYSHCSHSCGSGTMTRKRLCNHPAPAHGGHNCHGASTQSMTCNLKACVVNGGWGTWAHWTSCSATCNLGTISRTRACNHPAPAHGGATCAGNTTETHECSNGPCPVWTHWIEGTCSVSCGTGTRERVRHCSTGKDGDCGGVAYQQVPCTHVTCV